MSDETSWVSMGAEVTTDTRWEPSVQRVCVDGHTGNYRTFTMQLTVGQATDLAKQMLIAVAESQGAPLGGKA